MSITKECFDLENICIGTEKFPEDISFVSLNPDLIVDFGHFLNYELRLSDVLSCRNIEYYTLANLKTEIDLNFIYPVFNNDSGYYCLYRTSSFGKEKVIANELLSICQTFVGSLASSSQSDRRFVFFLYTGSSELAYQLSLIDIPKNWRFVINAFWDFLDGCPEKISQRLTRIKFSRNVQLLAMSELHRKEWIGKTGLLFKSIPNPPPLHSDSTSLAIIKRSLFLRHFSVSKVRRQIFFPGLMTGGKGKELTRDFFTDPEIKNSEFSYILRDRKSEIEIDFSSNVELVVGDLEQSTLEDIYFSSDIAVLPYSSSTFRVRTSGAIVDCLVAGVVPIVFAGTWLAEQCEKYNFGYVCKQESVAEIKKAINCIDSEFYAFRDAMYCAAGKYLNDNNWHGLVKTVINESKLFDAFSGLSGNAKLVVDDLQGVFSEANSLYRLGKYKEALDLYDKLKRHYGFSVYDLSIEMVQRKLKINF